MQITAQEVIAAAERIKPYIHHTPVLSSSLLDSMTGAQLFFKCENLQKAGAFKSRGAVNTVFSLSGQMLANGVATHSSGNHGAALARAAQLRGIPAYIVLPNNAKQAKKDAIAAYGAKIIECEATLQARQARLAEVAAQTSAYIVHPYDSESVIAGQGTAALELLEEITGLDVIVAPVGGGGLLAGTTLIAPQPVQVFGAEPENADDAKRSLVSGQRVTKHSPRTICDGLQTTLGKLNFEIIKAGVADILLVSEQQIVTAMELIWSRLKQVVEPSSAVTLAVVLRYPELFQGKRVGLILTGGNVDLAHLPFKSAISD